MDEYIVLEYATEYGATITTARRFTADEAKQYAEWFRSRGFVSVGDHIPLEQIKNRDLPSRECDGEFCGCNNRAWIITEAEKANYIALNNAREEAAEKAEREGRITALQKAIKQAEEQTDLPTEEEAQRRTKIWINVVNEGGEGYVPHIITRREYDRYKNELEKLEKENTK